MEYLWRLQGLDIINPNHTANAGTLSDKPTANGGGVSMLSAQILDRTDFYSGNLPTALWQCIIWYYGYVVAARVLAKRLQYTAQASLIGIDLAAEGPIQQETRKFVFSELSILNCGSVVTSRCRLWR
jgi:hypothetical protein